MSLSWRGGETSTTQASASPSTSSVDAESFALKTLMQIITYITRTDTRDGAAHPCAYLLHMHMRCARCAYNACAVGRCVPCRAGAIINVVRVLQCRRAPENDRSSLTLGAALAAEEGMPDYLLHAMGFY